MTWGGCPTKQCLPFSRTLRITRNPENSDSAKKKDSKITISNIPAKAYEYVVNGKSAIEMDNGTLPNNHRQRKQIQNDPNDWVKEVDNDRYILNLLLSIITVSAQTVEGLPKVKFD